ncbi:MAG: ABC transporter ATP-binding protein [Oscillospiraceae bacterium]
MKLIFRYIKPYKLKMLFIFITKFLGTIMDLLLPWILAHIIDDVVPLNSVNLVLRWGIAMIICAIIGVLTNVVANRMASKVAMLSARELRYNLFEKVNLLSCKQLDDMSIPSIISRLTSDTYTIHNYIGMMQRLGTRAPILLIGGIVMTLTLEPKLAVVLIALLPFMGIVIYKVTKTGVPLFAVARKSVDNLVSSVRENITGVRIIKALSKTEYEKERFDKINKQLIEKEQKAENTMAITNPTMNWFLNIGMTAVILVGAFLVNSGTSQAGKIIAFMSYFTIILNAMMSVTRIFVRSSKAIASADRLDEILNLPQDLTVSNVVDYKDNDCHIEFDDVSFSYHKKEANIKNISFKLKKGETLGIIGGTGSGKTTIINLLMRLYDVDKGAVRINGRNVKTIPAQELHQMFGVVFQDDVIFADTIKENIDFGRILDEKDIEISSEYSQAIEFVDSLPDGFDHKLTIKGANLSGGQKQRVLISRALAGSPEILILDDSSSALDYKTDSLLRKNLKENFGETTSVIIAQRISSIMNSEHILVLHEGEILGYGTHQELLKNCEMYREISLSQMGDKTSEEGEQDE